MVPARPAPTVLAGPQSPLLQALGRPGRGPLQGAFLFEKKGTQRSGGGARLKEDSPDIHLWLSKDLLIPQLPQITAELEEDEELEGERKGTGC